jgi:plasmid stabilization system protein ParE
MSYRLHIRAEAEADVTEAAQWYEQRSPGLGEEFVAEVDQTIKQVLENPHAFRVIHSRYELRRALMDRFPYRIFFTLKGDTIFIHAVLHGHRDDRNWKTRL